MDPLERMNNPLVAQKAFLRGNQRNIWTSLPCVVQSYDAVKMTCTLQPTIQAQTQDRLGKWSNVSLPVLVDVPVQFPAGGGFIMTFPLREGDEGIGVFSSRCIDSWWQSGGVQPQAEIRMHDLSDCMFIPGIFSQPRVLEDVNEDQCEIRNEAGTIKFTTSADGFELTGNLKVTGNIEALGTIKWPKGLFSGVGATIDGVLTATQDVTAGFGTINYVTLKNHLHTSAAPGNPTSTPTPGT